jgi:hypothetical protein
MSVSLGKAKSVLSKTWVDNVANLNEDEYAAMVVKAEQKIKALKEEMDNDEKLKAARQIAKDLSTGYSSVITMEKAKIRFLLEKIQEIQDGEVNPTASV